MLYATWYYTKIMRENSTNNILNVLSLIERASVNFYGADNAILSNKSNHISGDCEQLWYSMKSFSVRKCTQQQYKL